MKKIILIIVFLSLFSLVACSDKNEDKLKDTSSKGIIVAVSVMPQETFVKAICGDKVDVITLIPAGSSPENYEPTMDIMQKLNDCSVYFSIGVQTEKANIIPKLKDTNIISLNDGVKKVYEEINFSSGERDPHIWLSPKRVIVMIDIILEEMTRIDPDNSDFYSENAEEYKKQLLELDQDISEKLSNIKNRKFIAYHPAFGYFASDYDLEMYALEDEGHEATPKHLKDMIDLAKEENIKVLFYQEEIDSSQSKAFAEEIGGQTVKLSPLSKEYIENLSLMAEIMAEVME